MNFGEALEALKQGKKLERTGWNGRGLFIYYVPAAKFKALTEVAKRELGEEVQYNEYFALKNANNTVSTWAPSVSDALAEDWQIVEDVPKVTADQWTKEYQGRTGDDK